MDTSANPVPTQEQLSAHYQGISKAGRIARRCRMWLPSDVTGRVVLDLECRKELGVCMIAECVGATGVVIGVDSDAANIEYARAHAQESYHSDTPPARMEFQQGYLEDLAQAGIADASVDVVIVNSVLNLAYDMPRAMREIRRVLKPGGELHHACVLLAGDAAVSDIIAPEALAQLAASGDVRAGALTKHAFQQLLEECGFENVQFLELVSLLESEQQGSGVHGMPPISPQDEALIPDGVGFLAGVISAFAPEK